MKIYMWTCGNMERHCSIKKKKVTKKGNKKVL